MRHELKKSGGGKGGEGRGGEGGRGAREGGTEGGTGHLNPRQPLVGLAAARGLAFFGVRASWIAVVRGAPGSPFSSALGLTAALGFCGGNQGRVCTCQAAILRDGQSKAKVLPWRETSAKTLLLLMRRSCGCSEGLGATYHGLLSPLLLGAGAHVAIGHFAGLLSAEKRAAPSVWYLSASSSIFVFVVLANSEKLHCVDFSEEILQGAGVDRSRTLNFEVVGLKFLRRAHTGLEHAVRKASYKRFQNFKARPYLATSGARQIVVLAPAASR
jgi:hypothetical protein